MMTKLTVAAVLIALIVPALARDAKDILFIVLQDAKGEMSVYTQRSPHADCKSFLTEFRKHTKQKTAVMFTFVAPGRNENGKVEEGSMGKVIEAYCIRPNGSIEVR